MRRTNYFSALSDHHWFSTKQFSLYGGAVWSLVFSKWQHRYFMLVFCLTITVIQSNPVCGGVGVGSHDYVEDSKVESV